MALNPKTQQALMDMLKVKQPKSIAAPISPLEAMQMERGLLSTDPVISKLQKVGRGVKSLLEPETPMDYVGMVFPAAKAKKIATGIYQYRGHIIENRGDRWSWGKLPKGSKDWTDAEYHDASNNLKDAKNHIDYIIENNIK